MARPATAPRPRLLLPAYVLLFAVATLLVAFLIGPVCRRAPGGVFEADLARFAVNDPVLVSDHRFYVVRQPDGTVLAFSMYEARVEDDRAGCVIRFRETFPVDGTAGAFRSDCHGALYDRAGRPLGAETPPMKRHPVTVADSRVRVVTGECRDGSTGAATPCRPR